MVDIICEKINESGDSEQQSNVANSGPNYRGGPTGGATKLTDSATNPSEPCQCWEVLELKILCFKCIFNSLVFKTSLLKYYKF